MHIDLAGKWKFELDPADKGIEERWFQRPLANVIELPGVLQAQGYGDEVTVETEWVGEIVDRSFFHAERYAPYREAGQVKMPCWLTPDKYYMGVAWYQRDIEIPDTWAGQRISLFIERPHWQTRVWLNDQLLDAELSLSTPHLYDLGHALSPGTHRLTVQVDNRMIINVGPNSHSMSDHTQGNWNGMVGRLELQAVSPVSIAAIQIYPQIAHKTAIVTIQIANHLGQAGSASLRLQAASCNGRSHTPPPINIDIDLPRAGQTVHVEYPLGDEALLWDEFEPALYKLTCHLQSHIAGESYEDESAEIFGMREVGVKGTQITINERPVFLRGTLDCCIFPRTGYPPMGVEEWKRIMTICQAHGLNHIRFHSWCPPEAAFVAADELGVYLQVECSSWANQGTGVGLGGPLDRWLYNEGERIVDAYGNHPSFIMMAYGNEPGGRDKAFLGAWVNYWKGRDSRRVHTSGAGWPAIPENQFHNIPEPRVQAWGAELNSRINSKPPETVTDYADWVNIANAPIVSHEIGQWCVYPDFDEIEKYDGYLKAKNFEIFRDFLEANHMGNQAHDFLIASGKLQVLCYKEEIESALRTSGFAGFQLLGLNDFPGQGSALVGVLDPFWDSKPYVTPEQFRRFCHHTVPLARLEKRYWRMGETFSAEIEIAHYGHTSLADSLIEWEVVDSAQKTILSGAFEMQTIPTGTVTRCGLISAELKGTQPAQKLTLTLKIANTDIANDWDLWVFPDELSTEPAQHILITSQLDTVAAARLEQGGTVLLMPSTDQIRIESTIGFSSIFWNTSWTRNQAPHTLGILCDPAHALFQHFPTESHSNWQWWELIHGSAAMVLDELPPACRPLIQPIDTWFEARRLGLLLEANVNGGRLMVCSIDLQSRLDERLVARQLRHSLLRYMSSSAFAPDIALSMEQIGTLSKA